MSTYCPAAETASEDPRHLWTDVVSWRVPDDAPVYLESMCVQCGAKRVFVRREAWDRVKAALPDWKASQRRGSPLMKRSHNSKETDK